MATINATIINEVPKKSSKDEDGFMFVFDVNFPKGHKLEGKPVCKWFPLEGLDLMKTSKDNWRVEFTDEGAYVNKPLIDFFDVKNHEIDRKVMKLAEVVLSPNF